MKIKLLFLIVSIFFYACTVEEEVLPLKTNQLSVEVLNKNGLPKSGADVSLFKSLEDLQSRTSVLYTQKANSQGIATFSNLQTGNYFIYASYMEEGKVYDNEAVGDVFMEQTIEKNTHYQFFTITGFKRPLNPNQVKLKACWLMDYPTPLKIYDRPDSSLQMSLPIFIDFYVDGQFINGSGPLQFYRTLLKPYESQEIALAEYFKEPNPGIACNLLKKDKLEIRVFEQTLQGKLLEKESFLLDLKGYLGNDLKAFPDRIPVYSGKMHLDLMLGWE